MEPGGGDDAKHGPLDDTDAEKRKAGPPRRARNRAAT